MPARNERAGGMSETAELARGFLIEIRAWLAPASELTDYAPGNFETVARIAALIDSRR
jgi:hypothetical protein